MNEAREKASVYCPDCKIPTQVIDTRGTGDNEVRRRRKCSVCNKRFTTYEGIYEQTGDSVKLRRQRAKELLAELSEMLGI